MVIIVKFYLNHLEKVCDNTETRMTIEKGLSEKVRYKRWVLSIYSGDDKNTPPSIPLYSLDPIFPYDLRDLLPSESPFLVSKREPQN